MEKENLRELLERRSKKKKLKSHLIGLISSWWKPSIVSCLRII
jgi:hypothetical protein